MRDCVLEIEAPSPAFPQNVNKTLQHGREDGGSEGQGGGGGRRQQRQSQKMRFGSAHRTGQDCARSESESDSMPFSSS